jgi:Holliday junction resolvase
MPKMSRDKGKRGEREAAAILNDLFGCAARRSQQYCGEAGDADLTTDLEGVHFEVKRVERFQLHAALRQACEDATPDDIPVVLHKSNRNPWVVVLKLDDLPTLAERITEQTQ